MPLADGPPWMRQLYTRRYPLIASLAITAIGAYLLLWLCLGSRQGAALWPLYVALALGGVPIVVELLVKLLHREFGSDLLAGISIVTSVLLGEYLAGTLVVLMLSGGEAIESYAVRSAAGVLRALAKRMPLVAHLRRNSQMEDVPLDGIVVGDLLVVFPHEICPVDGEVLEGHGVMDESYLTGEPYRMSKTPGSTVLSGSINGETALVIRATRRAVDSRYAQIMRVMQESEQRRPRIRRLADQLGALYTPLAVAIAVAAWAITGQPVRFLAVLVVATPCPLLIAIPVAIIGSISLAARRGIIVRDPAVLEQIDTCRTVIFDKTGTLTYGEPRLTEQLVSPAFTAHEVLILAATLERYSKHPLAEAIVQEAQRQRLAPCEAAEIHEKPGAGLQGVVAGRNVQITSRQKILAAQPELATQLPPLAGGLECAVLIDGKYAAIYRFRDQPRHEGISFVHHLAPKHHFDKVLLVSGDRESEVRYLADQVGIIDVYAEQSPEDKVNIVRRETQLAPTLFLGDGINDAPALLAATVGLAFGTGNEITGEASGAVVMDTSLERVDEFLHISRRMRRIALQSAVGGMAASILAMVIAAAGYLPPVAGAILQEVIDILAVTNAVRAAWPPKSLSDF
ncbi:MAG TPA: heavy metal translocating P-type ATPase [Pirellulales bacterium]|nr:heavy metal translocating P-type ATPase [Pirellulales bacterium]